ncbi:F-box protein PP2-A13 [Bienertia sinuspersici]
MGGGMSSASSTSGAKNGRKMEDIPESCIAMVLAHLDPPEICRLARLNRAFRGASSADFIWEAKLPTNYSFILNRITKLDDDDDLKSCNHSSSRNSNEFKGLMKKDIYARLSRPNLFDSDTKEVWLDKKTGGVCLSISSKALSIIGINDRRYWNRIPTEESRFQTIAYLVQIWWFEVCGELEFKFPAGEYSLFFRLQLGKSSKRFGRRTCNIEHIHGWNARPVRFQLTTADGQHDFSDYYLDNPGSWTLYRGGNFVIKDPDKLTKIKFSARQIDCTHTKGGLSLDSVVILPKSLAKKG